MKHHLADYLEYYCSLKNPKFAVLIKGAWGSGKTYQVKAAFEAMAAKREYRADPNNPDDPIWVSLYGIDATHSLDAAVIAASDKSAHLGLGGLKIIGDLSRGIGGFFAAGAIASELAGPILRRSLAGSNHRVLVFDDLERCLLPLDQSLGAINHYVETLGFKAIIIAHEDKIIEEMAKRKEKLIGQTLTVSPDFDNASKHFINEIENAEARSFLFAYEPEVSDAFAKCDIFSLRILRHVFFDIARLYDCLNKDQVQKSTAMGLLIKKVALLSGLFREGALTSRDFDNFSEKEMYAGIGFRGDHNNDERQGPLLGFDMAMKRLEASGASNNLRSMSDQTIKAIVVEARYDKDEIQRSVSESGLFGDALEARSWWRVWHKYGRTDAQVKTDIEEMELDFRNRQFSEIPDVLHLFSQRLLLAHEHLLDGKSVVAVLEECEAYITDMLDKNILLPAKRLGRHSQYDFGGAYGLGFTGASKNSPTYTEFTALTESLDRAQQKALQNSFPHFLSTIQKLLEDASDKNMEMVHSLLADTQSKQSYAEIPIFMNQDSKVIFKVISKLDGKHLDSFSGALRSRYYGQQLYNGLDPEIDWALGLKKLAEDASTDNHLPALRKWRLKAFIRRSSFEDIERRKQAIREVELAAAKTTAE